MLKKVALQNKSLKTAKLRFNTLPNLFLPPLKLNVKSKK